MDEPLQIIRRLYDDSADPAAARRLGDEALEKEYNELRAVKDVLDQRDPASPDPDVVDQIVAAAKDAADERAPDGAPAPSSPEADALTAAQTSAAPSEGRSRNDRAPTRSTSTSAPQRLWRRAGAALAVVFVVGLGWWQLAPTGTPAPESTASARVQTSEGDASGAARSSAAGRASAGPAAADLATSQPAARSASALPDWDEGDDVVRLHRRLELLSARSQPVRWNGAALIPTRAPRP